VDETDKPVNEKSSPVPVSVTVWGLPAAVSVTVTAPVLVPPAVGLKVTLRVQPALTATLEPQSLVWKASPLAVMLAMLRVALPVLLRLTV
jgi:ABC-type sulfate transport system permease component